MEVNENVRLSDSKAFLDSEIKKLSENWANHLINLRAFERRQRETLPTKQEKEIHEEIEKSMKNKKEDKKLSYLESLDEETRKIHQAVEEYNRIDLAIENNEKGKKECEELLEVMQTLLSEFEQSLNENSNEDPTEDK